jgi:hypothetical protein
MQASLKMRRLAHEYVFPCCTNAEAVDAIAIPKAMTAVMHFYYSLIHPENEYASLMVEFSTTSTAEISKSAISEIVEDISTA